MTRARKQVSGRKREKDDRGEVIMKPATELTVRSRTTDDGSRSRLRLLPLALIIASGLRCGEAPTQPIGPRGAPTPPPQEADSPDLRGAWAGEISFPSDCFTCRTPERIQVTLSQVGNTVSGAFSTDCLGNVELRGTLKGDRLTVNLSRVQGIRPFEGSATSTRIGVETNCDLWGYGNDHTMRLDLSR
jgi:hypothetical protein